MNNIFFYVDVTWIKLVNVDITWIRIVDGKLLRRGCTKRYDMGRDMM